MRPRWKARSPLYSEARSGGDPQLVRGTGSPLVYTDHVALPFKIAFWVLIVFVGLALIKRLTKVAILVTILIILIFVARAVIVNLP